MFQEVTHINFSFHFVKLINMRKNLFFIFKIIYLWNALPCNVISTNITKAFANHLYKINSTTI